MNKLKGKITEIKTHHHISLVSVGVNTDILHALVIETPQTAPYLKIGTEVSLLFKETEVSLAKNLSGFICFGNRIKAKVSKIEQNPLLAQVTLNYYGKNITSIISATAIERMQLKENDDVEWLVKANEISILAE
ncbi:MAG: TOBE domain-containing protein [Candidatus Omnitrophota bacterium]